MGRIIGLSVVLIQVLFLTVGSFQAGAVTLDQCIRTSLESNPDVKAGLQRIAATQASIKQATSAYYPVLFLTGAYTLTDNPTQAFMMTLNQRNLNMTTPGFNPNDPEDTDNIRFSVGMKYSLYDGGQRRSHVTSSKRGSAAAELGLASVRNELIHQVIRGYYGLLQAQAFVQVQTESVESLKESLRVATERFNAGSAVKSDMLNLEVKLAQAREDLIRAENSVQLSRAGLNTAIGKEMISADLALEPSPEGRNEKPPELDLSLVENRPELQAVREMVQIREQDYQKTSRTYHPTLNAFGSYDWDGEQLDSFEGSYLVGVMAEWELFTGFRRPNSIAKAKADWQVSKYAVEKARNNLKLDLRAANIKALEAWQRMNVTGKSVESADEALRITSELYQRGAADITMLLTAQVGLTAQKTREIAAYYDFQIACSNLRRAKGELVKDYAMSQ